MSAPHVSCLFCTLPSTRVIHANDVVLVIHDAFPVSAGHTLVLPKRHTASFFDLSVSERANYWKCSSGSMPS